MSPTRTGRNGSASAEQTWDPFRTNYLANPYETYRWLRNESPVFRTNTGIFALSRFDDVRTAARDWHTFSSAGPGGINLDDEASIAPRGNFINMDPPRHDVLRKLLRPWFAPRDLKRLKLLIETLAHESLTRLAGRTEADLSQEVAWSIPIRVISHLLGLPSGDAAYLNELLARFGQRVPGSAHMPPWGWNATESMREYLGTMAAESRRNRPEPDRDILSGLVAAQSHDPTLSDDHVTDLALLVLIAGTETSAAMLSSSLHLLGDLDPNLCEGHATCAVVAPDLFDFDDESDQGVVLDEQPGETLAADADEAVRACPVRAITVE